MARAFKDMIVQEADGKPRLTFRNRQGAAVLEDVSVEVSSTVQQQGDAWGALEANLLMELDDDDVPYAVAPEFTPAAAPAALTPREKLATAFGKLAAAVSALISHMVDKNNPHVTTAAQVGSYTKSETDSKTEREGQYQRDIFGADRREQSEDRRQDLQHEHEWRRS